MIDIDNISMEMFHDMIAFGENGVVITPDGIRSATVDELEEAQEQCEP